MKRASTAVAIALAAVLSAPACSQEDIVLGTVPDNGSSVNAKTGARCVTSAECGDGAFCNRHDCAAEAGICEPYPVSCPGDEHPVCGCDGVTYFNDCLRRGAGVIGSEVEECGDGDTALPCDTTNLPCPAGAVCAFFGPSCKSSSGGHCWVIPPQCPADSRPNGWDACGAGGEHCVSTCDAIRLQAHDPTVPKPYVRTASFCP